MRRLLPAGFVTPCQPSSVQVPSVGADWVHQIKYDGFRLIVRRNGARVRLFTRNGHDWAARYPAIAAAALRARSFLMRAKHTFCWAFDLLERDGQDLRALPLEQRRAELRALLKCVPFGLALNDAVSGDRPALFAEACAMGLEGIVSKRRSSPYRSGRSSHWLKAKNPESPAARREAVEDWGKKGR